MSDGDVFDPDHRGYGSRFEGFPDLMGRRIQDVLLVSSLYDSFILAEDGHLNETVLGEFLDLNLRHAPGLTWVSSGEKALALVRSHRRYNLIVSSLQVGDMNALELAHRVREAGLNIPVVLLAYDNRALVEFTNRHDVADLAGTFLWQGDVRILLAIVKLIEDMSNLEHDVGQVGVPAILVVEDNVRYYSSFLPVIYTELMNHAQRLIPDGLNLAHKLMRIRARPKILLCKTYEEAWTLFERYTSDILAIISDIEFPRNGAKDPKAGVLLATNVQSVQPDIPIMLQSSVPENRALAEELGAAFLLKGSPLLLQQLREFMIDGFGFGDFVFRRPDGTEVDRAKNLRTLAEKLATIPNDSLQYHGSGNHFSRWLKIRTEFALAERIRPEKVSDFPDIESVRGFLIESIQRYRRERNRGIVADFDAETFDGTSPFSLLGGGSLGGKARGLAFVNFLLAEYRAAERFPGIQISVPPTVVVGTDVFDEFLDQNDLRDFAISCQDDDLLFRRFMEAPFPLEHRRELRAYVETCDYPIAVRSSGLLEDSAYQPFAGVYETFMLSNTDPDPTIRLLQLVEAIKRVYVSMYTLRAKAYVDATPYRLEEEKMAVVLQKIVGSRHDTRYYPDFAGVCRSHNFYPTAPLTAEDGIAAVALGLGRTVVEGEKALRFCPRYPRHVMQFSTIEDVLQSSQRDFWALDLDDTKHGRHESPELRMVQCDLSVAEEDGTLGALGSTYSHENRAVYDGLSRDGSRIVTFAPILKHGLFPLADVLTYLLEIGEEASSAPVELEFAVNLSTPPGEPKEFGFLQMRPLAMSRELEELRIGTVDDNDLVCQSTRVLGHGKLDGIRDVVVVDYNRFDRARSRDTAGDVAHFNAELLRAGVPYLLIGVGRWGSTDPWLGVPVTWDQIAGARVIVETEFKDLKVAPSQGTHFFQNLTSCNIGYFTISAKDTGSFVDWDWLAAQPAVGESGFVRHVRFADPVEVRMNGRTGRGVIFKPGVDLDVD